MLADRDLLAQRQPELGPSGNTVFEVAGVEADTPQRDGGLLADLLAVCAIDDDRLVRAEIAGPMTNLTGLAAHGRDQHPVVGVERGGTAHINDERRGGGAEPMVKRLCGNGKTAFVHECAPRGASGAELGRSAV